VKAVLISRHEFSHARRSSSTRPMNEPRPTSFTILVIDDDSGLLESATELLETEEHRVLAAASGDTGLAMARTVRPDLILIDYHMPEMNGLEVVRRLKADIETREIPLVALTSGPAEDANELIRAGCIAFIPKPFEPVSFLRLVAGILNVTVGRGRRSSDPRS
jgi:CheY-like chemotaxis protein